MAVKTAAEQKAYEDQITASWNAAKAKEKPVTQTPQMAAHSSAVEAFKQANWQNGGTTVTPTTGAQNLNAVINQPGSTVGQSANIQGIQTQAAKDTAAQQNTGGGTVQSNNNIGTTTPTGMNLAVSQMQTYVPPAATGLSWDQATNQVKGQIDPMFQRALEALQAQKHQDQLNGSELGSARGGAHSGLAADLQNKVAIGAAGKAADLDATRQTQIAEMAQALVNRGEDNDYRNKQAALAEYLGLTQLDLQKQGQTADYTGMFGGQQTLEARNADRNYNQSQQVIDYNQNPNNPSNIGQGLQNTGQAQQNLLNQYKIDSYPSEQKAAATKIQQELALGKMDVETAEYNLKQLKDPNSPVNQISKLDLQMKQLEAKNLPEQQRLELQQLKKQIAQIGVVHYKPQTQAEIDMDKVQLDTAKKQLEILTNKKPDAEDYSKDISRISELYVTPAQYGGPPKVNNPTAMRNAIIALGMEDAETDRYLLMYGMQPN